MLHGSLQLPAWSLPELLLIREYPNIFASGLEVVPGVNTYNMSICVTLIGIINPYIKFVLTLIKFFVIN